MKRSETTPLQRYAEIAVILLFLTGIGLPLADMVFGFNPTEPNGEKRELACSVEKL